MPTWDDLRYLLAVSRNKTMIAAANEMQTNVATVSRHIQKISDQLGYAALHKTNEGWRINERLSELITAAEEFDHRLRAAHAQTDNAASLSMVPIRMGCEPLYTFTVIMPRLAILRQELPRIALSIHSRFGGEGLGEYDLVVASARPETGRLIVRRLKNMAFGLFQLSGAAPSKDWIGLNEVFDSVSTMRMAETHFGRPPILRLTHYQQIFEAARVTGLPALLPFCCTTRAADLVPMPGAPPLVETERWVYYHESRKGDVIFETFMRWLIEADRENDALTRAAAAF